MGTELLGDGLLCSGQDGSLGGEGEQPAHPGEQGSTTGQPPPHCRWVCNA